MSVLPRSLPIKQEVAAPGEAVLEVRADRHAFRPYGLYGGSPGHPARNVMNPGAREEAKGALQPAGAG